LKKHSEKAIEKKQKRMHEDGDQEEKKPKFDRNDPEQMEALKFRDIKRYRKEMRKIKKDVRAKHGEPVID
jgi:hypothetical protein